MGGWGGTSPVHRRGTSEPELLLLHTQRTGRPWAQRPQRPAQRGADTQGTPVLTPISGRPSSTRAWTCEDAEGRDSGSLLRFPHPSSALYASAAQLLMTGRLTASRRPSGGQSCQMSGSLRSVGVSGASDKKGLLDGVNAAARHPFTHPPSGEHLWAVTWRPEGIRLTWSPPRDAPRPGPSLPPPTHSAAGSRALSLVRLP